MYQYLTLWILHIIKLCQISHFCWTSLRIFREYSTTSLLSPLCIRNTQICRKLIGFVCENEHRRLIKMSIRNHYRHLRSKLSSHRNPFRLMLNKKWSHTLVLLGVMKKTSRDRLWECTLAADANWKETISLSDEDGRCWDDTLIYLHETFLRNQSH